jgi:hypothetical protein
LTSAVWPPPVSSAPLSSPVVLSTVFSSVCSDCSPSSASPAWVMAPCSPPGALAGPTVPSSAKSQTFWFSRGEPASELPPARKAMYC